MTKTADTIWSNCLKIIKDIVEWQHFKTWFEPIKPVEVKGSVLMIQVPSQFFYEYLDEHYVNLLAKEKYKNELIIFGKTELNISIDFLEDILSNINTLHEETINSIYDVHIHNRLKEKQDKKYISSELHSYHEYLKDLDEV